MKYPEGLSVEVTFSPTLQRFNAVALLNGGLDELFSCSSLRLSDALKYLAYKIAEKYEE